MDLVVFILFSFGISNILVYGSIFNKIRPSYSFFHCMMCVSFWASGLSFLLVSLSGILEYELSLLNLFIFSSLGSGTSYILGSLVDDRGFKLEISNNRGE